MRVKKCVGLIVLLSSMIVACNAHADTYSTFQTTRYYSANRRYFVIVTEKKQATLYRNGRRLNRIWSQTLAELPNQLFVANDGKRVAIVDRYYGNGGAPEAKVVIILDENGKQIADHQLGDVAKLGRVIQTISAAHWYQEARLSPDGQILIIETQVTKRDWDECHRDTRPGEAEKCWETVPYQQLRFALVTGELIERKGYVLK